MKESDALPAGWGRKGVGFNCDARATATSGSWGTAAGRTSSAEIILGVLQPIQMVPMRCPLLATSGAAA